MSSAASSSRQGELDADLVSSVQKIQPEREQADYDAWAAPAEDARHAIELADTFIAAIEQLCASEGTKLRERVGT